MTEQRIKILKIAAVLFFVLFAMSFNFLWSNAYFFLFSGKARVYVSPTAQKNVTRPEMGEPNTLHIPSLKITAPIIYIDEANENAFQKALQNGVVHYPKTAEQGKVGNCYIFGHSSDYMWSSGHYKTVLALLPQIEIGDEVIVSNTTGEKFVYTVVKSFVASPKDLHLLDQGDGTKKMLTLQTSYPLGTALKRWIVQAEMK